MNKRLLAPIVVLLMAIAICSMSRCGHANKLGLYKRALADTNVALTEAQTRASAYQAQAQRLGKLYHKHSGHFPQRSKHYLEDYLGQHR